MRDLKFRGISKDTGLFVHGNLIQSSVYKDGHTQCWIQEKSLLGLGAVSTPTANFTEVHSKTVGQFTGLQDKNGVGIYEGDILAFTHEWEEQPTKQVVFNNEFHSYTLLSKEDKRHVDGGYNHFKYWDTDEDNIYLLHQVDAYQIEVVGNIHQNSELLASK